MHHLFKLKKIFLILPLFFLLTACPVERNIAQKTPAELMAMQTRDFDTNKENAIGGIIAVFQDLGFIIETSDFNTGLITAKSPTQGNYSLWGRKMVDTKGTGTVREMGSDKVKIRLTFVAIDILILSLFLYPLPTFIILIVPNKTVISEFVYVIFKLSIRKVISLPSE